MNHPVETLEKKVDRYADQYNVSREKLRNLVTSESGWDTYAVGDDGCSLGLTQINTCAHNITHEEAFDPDFALDWTAYQLSIGNEHWWSVCSCVLMTRVKMREMEGKELPQGDAEDFIPNSSFGEGKVLILDYNGRRHLAYQIDHTEDGLTVFQGNKKPCKVDTELLTWKHLQTHLVGFYDVK